MYLFNKFVIGQRLCVVKNDSFSENIIPFTQELNDMTNVLCGLHCVVWKTIRCLETGASRHAGVGRTTMHFLQKNAIVVSDLHKRVSWTNNICSNKDTKIHPFGLHGGGDPVKHMPLNYCTELVQSRSSDNECNMLYTRKDTNNCVCLTS